MNKDFEQWLMKQQYTWAQKGMIGITRYTWVSVRYRRLPKGEWWVVLKPQPPIKYELGT